VRTKFPFNFEGVGFFAEKGRGSLNTTYVKAEIKGSKMAANESKNT